MGDRFVFQEKTGHRVTLHIHPKADFHEILTTLDSIQFPQFIANTENLKYAVLELLSNSLRAHREKKVNRSIVAVFDAGQDRLEVSIRDFGGGFDPGKLPYRLEDEAGTIDLCSPEFEDYQKRNNYQRFGMGLLVAKRTFPRFELSFFDDREEPVRWGQGPVRGTLIRMGTEK